MVPFKRELRLRSLAAIGDLDAALVNDDQACQHLDGAIANLAGDVLSPKELIVFFFLYSCKKTWREVWDMYNQSSDDVVDLRVVRRTARRVVKKIKSNADSSDSIRFWRKQQKS